MYYFIIKLDEPFSLNVDTMAKLCPFHISKVFWGYRYTLSIFLTVSLSHIKSILGVQVHFKHFL